MSEPGIPPRLSVVTLGVRDVATMRDFYKGLGWSTSFEAGDGFASFLLGGVVLALFPDGELAEEALRADENSGARAWSGITLACNLDTPEEVDEAWTGAVERGATPVAEPVDRPWGGRSGYIADPEGNRWEIAWAPGMSFDDRGAVTRFGD